MVMKATLVSLLTEGGGGHTNFVRISKNRSLLSQDGIINSF